MKANNLSLERKEIRTRETTSAITYHALTRHLQILPRVERETETTDLDRTRMEVATCALLLIIVWRQEDRQDGLLFFFPFHSCRLESLTHCELTASSRHF